MAFFSDLLSKIMTAVVDAKPVLPLMERDATAVGAGEATTFRCDATGALLVSSPFAVVGFATDAVLQLVRDYVQDLKAPRRSTGASIFVPALMPGVTFTATTGGFNITVSAIYQIHMAGDAVGAYRTVALSAGTHFLEIDMIASGVANGAGGMFTGYLSE